MCTTICICNISKMSYSMLPVLGQLQHEQGFSLQHRLVIHSITRSWIFSLPGSLCKACHISSTQTMSLSVDCASSNKYCEPSGSVYSSVLEWNVKNGIVILFSSALVPWYHWKTEGMSCGIGALLAQKCPSAFESIESTKAQLLSISLSLFFL